MKIEKLKSGSYRVRKMYQGKSCSVTFDHRPTQKEAAAAISEKLSRFKTEYDKLTFADAAREYVEMKRNVLSPKTVKEYSEMPSRLPDWFVRLAIADIDQVQINRLVNSLSAGRSPKTVRNYHGFMSAVLATYKPELRITTKLPQMRKETPYIPSTDDVRRVLEEVKGTELEIPIALGCFGLRRSEICALDATDVDGDVIHVRKALVQDEKNKWVIKQTKTTDSTRDIVVPAALADAIRRQGYAFRGYPEVISKSLARIEKKLGIPYFSLHKLRHYFASEMSALGVPDADILRMGGWKTDNVMKSVYRHSMMEKDLQAKRAAAERFSDTLFR